MSPPNTAQAHDMREFNLKTNDGKQLYYCVAEGHDKWTTNPEKCNQLNPATFKDRNFHRPLNNTNGPPNKEA